MGKLPVSVLLAEDDDDVTTASRVIGAAFDHLKPSRYLTPDEQTRRELFPGFFELAYIRPAHAAGMLYVTADRMAAAAWIPITPGQPKSPADVSADRTVEQILRRAIGPDLWPNFAAFDQRLGAAHAAHIRPHHFLGVLGAHPALWRQGSGTALLNAHYEVLDARGIPGYLEAAEPDLVAYYTIHGGWKETGQRIILPDHTVMTPMWREPRP